MNTRFQQFLQAENISQSQFADTIGVTRASISHVLAGRNKPGFDFFEGIVKNFPTLNIDWLISGKGKMYKNGYQPEISSPLPEPVVHAEDVPSTVQADTQIAGPAVQTVQDFNSQNNSTVSERIPESPQKPQTSRRIEKIVIFYDDYTFQEIKG